MAQTKMPHQPIRCFLFVKGGNYRNSSMLQWKNTHKSKWRALGGKFHFFSVGSKDHLSTSPQERIFTGSVVPLNRSTPIIETIGVLLWMFHDFWKRMARVYYMCYLRGSIEFQSTTCRNHFGKTIFINFHWPWLVRQYIHQLLLVKQISCNQC